MDWIYGQIVGFLGNFFALMGNMGVELFELEWVSAIILFFSRLAWALFAVSVVVCAFECGIEYSTGRGNLQQCGMNIIKGFLAVSLFTVVPVRLYALSVSLQGTFSAGLTGYGRSIGEVGQDIITELSEIQTLSDVINSSHFGLGMNIESSASEHCFHKDGTDKSLYVFEAPIDLLSHITLYPYGWQEHSYVACCGTSIQPVLERLRQNPKLDTVYLCLDNDDAGNDACDRMTDTLEDMGLEVERLCPVHKDWNDDLRAKFERKENLP